MDSSLTLLTQKHPRELNSDVSKLLERKAEVLIKLPGHTELYCSHLKMEMNKQTAATTDKSHIQTEHAHT